MSINFGEEMAYWYLRLNGFLPMSNFVLHRNADYSLSHSADADLLAVRMPGATESIGGQKLDYDESFLKQLCESFDSKTIGVYVEVKTGTKMSSSTSFSPERLLYARERLGKAFTALTPKKNSAKRVPGASICNETFCFAKILFYDDARMRVGNDSNYVTVSLSSVNTFLKNRLCPLNNSLIADRKSRDRLFFSSDLIQYMLWRDGSMPK